MKRLLTSSLMMILTAAEVVAQTSPAQNSSPKDVVEAFTKLETTGGRLTDQGWREASVFFVRAGPPPAKRIILVTDPRFSVWDPIMRSSTRAEVIADAVGDTWKIDPQMRLTLDIYQMKSFFVYRLVLTDKHWEPGPDGITEKETAGPLAWRIEDTGNYIWLTVDVAIRYVTKVRDHTTNATVKQNAERTLARLKRYRANMK